MPKGKKFIDKKNSVTFHLVHRSQQDPLVADDTAPQRVLVPVTQDRKGKGKEKEKLDPVKRKEEQQKYGIFFDDDYNYLQHLRSANEVSVDWEAVSKLSSKKDECPASQTETNITEGSVKVQLPSSVFASAVEEDIGLLNKAAPSGLCLDYDPDVIAALDADFDFKDPDNILEDNFVEIANRIAEEDEDNSDVCSSQGSGYYGGSDEENDDLESLPGEFLFEKEETKSRFTNYSMSSSVIRRNEQLTLLDDRFEQIYADYDDHEIGALDCEEIEGHIPANADILMQYATEFAKEDLGQMDEKEKTLHLVENMASDSEVEMDIIEITDKTDKWDCESILSTYSNLYNHPKLITEPKKPPQIRISQHTGIPLNVLDNSGNKLTARSLAKFNAFNNQKPNCEVASVISRLSQLSTRSKSETPEERRERKKAIRAYRRERRIECKANTLAFKEEKKRQEKILLNNKNNQQGIKIL